jgi:Tfp pilus assembly protein PilF
MPMKYAIVLALAVAACGGSKPAESPEPGATPPPRLPPSMAGGGGPETPPPDDTSAGGAPSDEVAKGMKSLDAGDAAGAKAHAEAALKKNPKDADAFTLLGMVAEKSHDKAAAEKAYKDALKLKPDLEAAAVNLSAIYADGEKWDEAEKVARAAIGKHADNPSLHLNLAIALAGKSDQAQSGKEFDEAERLAPKQAMPLYVHGHWLGAWNQTDAAGVKLRAARALAQDDAAMLGAIGHELLVLRAAPDCVATFDKAIALKDAAEFRTERGLCKLAAKDKTGAVADFQAAVDKEPSYPLAHYWLGGMLAQAGKAKEGQAQLETYLKLAPNGPKAQAAKDAIAKIKGGKK